MNTGSPALSSAEAEGYALGSGACEGLFICSVAKELSFDLKLAVYSDSTATISQPALSSAEAEGYALGSGACEGLFICSVAKELSFDLKLAVYSDSTATISQHSKLGLGRMKHVELRFMFVKDVVKREKLSLCKIPGTDNPADLGTKMLDVATHRLGSVKQAVEEVKGHRRNSQSSRSVGLQNVWKGLRTLCLGLAQWARENSMSMNFHELRISCPSAA